MAASSDEAARSADVPPPAVATLDLHLHESRQLFNMMDPAPFRERDLDPAAEAYIVDWGREAPQRGPLALVVHLSPERATPATASILRDALHSYFVDRAAATRRDLKRLFRDGRISLAIGIAFVALAFVTGQVLVTVFTRESYATILQDSIVIGAWVALWRPIEIFFYDWWPILREARLYDRLGAMDVRVVAAPAAAPAAST